LVVGGKIRAIIEVPGAVAGAGYLESRSVDQLLEGDGRRRTKPFQQRAVGDLDRRQPLREILVDEAAGLPGAENGKMNSCFLVPIGGAPKDQGGGDSHGSCSFRTRLKFACQ